MINKKLLTTTAMVALFVGSAVADGNVPATAMTNDLAVKLGGMGDFYAVSKAASRNTDNITKNNDYVGFSTDAWVWLDVSNTTAKGLEYGAHLGLTTHAQSARNPANANTSLDNTYLWLAHNDWGRMEFGSNDSADASMRIGADNIAVASGGIAGNWFQAAISKRSDGQVSPNEFLLTPWNVSDNALNFDFNTNSTSVTTYQEKARKITYYSPKWYGFQGGFSYTPDSQNVGNASLMPNTAGSVYSTGLSDVYSGGITWDGRISNDLMGGVSLVGIWGSARPGVDDSQRRVKSAYTRGFDLGTMLMYRDFKFALSYGFLDNTGLQSHQSKHVPNSVMYGTTGLSYNWNKLHTSFTYFYGHKNGNQAHVASLGAEYALATGIMPYAETTFYDLTLNRIGGIATAAGAYVGGANGLSDNSTTSTKLAKSFGQNGVAFIVGTKLKF